MIRRKCFTKIITILLLFCLFIQPLDVLGITVQAAGNDTTLDIADGIITVTNRNYVVKDTGGTTVSSGTLPSDGELIITGVYNNNDHLITLNGSDIPTLHFKNISTKSYIKGSVSGNLTIKLDGNCYFTGGIYSNLSVTGTFNIMGLANNQVKTGSNSLNGTNNGSEIIDGVNFVEFGGTSFVYGSTSYASNSLSMLNCIYNGTSTFGINTINNPFNTNNCNFSNWSITVRDGGEIKNTIVSGVNGSTSQFQIFNDNGKVTYIKDSNLSATSYTINSPVVITNTVMYASMTSPFSFQGAYTRLIGSSFINSVGTGITGSQTAISQKDCSFVFTGNYPGKRFYSGTFFDPYNPSMVPTYLNKLKVPGITGASQVLTKIDSDDEANLMTDSDGYLYLYLTAETHTVTCQYNGCTYTYTFEGASTRENSLTSNNMGTLVPNRGATVINFNPYANKTIDYSFDNSTWNNITTDSNCQFSIVFPDSVSNIYLRYDGNLYKSTVDELNNASIPVLAAPEIKNQSPSQAVIKAGSTALYVEAVPFNQGEELTYQWFKDGVSLSGKTRNILQLTNINTSDAGSYTCKISESGIGAVTSAPIMLSVTDINVTPELRILSQSSDKTIIKGYSTDIYVLAQPENVTYEWSKDGQIIPGSNQNQLTVTGTVSGSAIYVCKVSGDSTVVSQPIKVSIIDNPLESDIADLNAIKDDLQGQVTSLNNQLGNLQSEKNNLEITISDLQGQVSSLITQISSLQGQLSKAQADLQGANNDKDALNSTITALNEQIHNLQSEINNLNQSLEEANNQKSALQQQINILTSDNNALKDQITALNNAVATKDAENTALKSQVSSLQNQVNGLQQNLSDLQGQLDSLTEDKNKLSNQVQQLNSDKQELLSQLNNLQQQLNTANETIDTLTAKVADLLSQLGNAVTQKEALESTVSGLNDQISDLISQIGTLKDQVNALESQLQNSNESNQNLLKTINDLNNQISTLTQSLAEKENQISQLGQEKDILQNTVNSLSTQVATLESKVIELQNSISGKEIEITGLKDTMAVLQNNVTSLQNAITQITGEKEEAENKLQEALSKLSELQNVLLTIKSELGVVNDSEILPAIKQLKTQLELQTNANTVLQNQIVDINKQLSDAQKSNTSMQDKLNDLMNIVGAENQDAIKEKILILQSDLVNSGNQINQLLQEKSKLDQQLSDANEKILNLQKQIDDLLALSGQDTAELLKQIKNLNDQILTLSHHNKVMQEQITSLTEKVNDLNGEKVTYQSEIARLQTLLDTANSSLEEVKNKLADAVSENTSLKAENESLKKQIEELKKQNSGGTNNSTPSENTSVNNELKTQLDKALTDLDTKNKELAQTQQLLENAKEDTQPSIPENAVIVTSTKSNEAAPVAVKEMAGADSTKEPIETDYLTAENGWQLAKDLDSVWSNKLSINTLIGSSGTMEIATKANFYAREKKQPKKIYHYSINVKKPISIPNFDMDKLIYMNSTFNLNLANLPKGAAVTYSTSNKDVAKVSKEGTITPVKEGKAIVTGKVTGIENPYQFKIHVTVKGSDQKTLNLKEKTIKATSDAPILLTYKLLGEGKSTKIHLSGLENAKITYISSDANIVTVQQDGTVTGKNKGFATVTAILAQNDTIYTYIIRVRVADGSNDTGMWKYLSAN